MRSFTILDNRLLAPFNEPARELIVIGPDRIPLTMKFHHAELKDRCLGTYSTAEVDNLDEVEQQLNRVESGKDSIDEVFIYRDNIYFDFEFLQYFLAEAKATGMPCRAVFPEDDSAWMKYAVPLSSLKRTTDAQGRAYYPIDMWYFPQGWAPPERWHHLPVYSDALEKGYYNTPDTMTSEDELGRRQDLTHYQSERTCVVLESWVHLFNAMIPLGVFSYGSRFEEYVKRHNFYAISLLFKAVIEQKQIRSTSAIVKIGKGTQIDPSAVILGPTIIGANCDIGPGVVIDNCVIGDNVTIAQGCQLMLSVVGGRCFLPFRSSLFMTFLMDSTIVAQNTCLQMCVVGKESFIGAGSTFTDFNLLPSPIKAINHEGKFEDIRQPVIGGCVGHNCRLGAGLVIYPARMIESDVILTASPERRVVMREINYEMSDHHKMPPHISVLHQRRYSRNLIKDESELLDEW